MPRTAEQKRAMKRKVLPGYPVAPYNMTPEQRKDYFGRDTIVCLLCGQQKASLGAHLSRIHEISVEEYQNRYGLPLYQGLTCQIARIRYSVEAKKRGVALYASVGPEQAAIARAAKAQAKRTNFLKRNPDGRTRDPEGKVCSGDGRDD